MRMIGSTPSFRFSRSPGLTLVAFLGVLCAAYEAANLILEGDVGFIDRRSPLPKFIPSLLTSARVLLIAVCKNQASAGYRFAWPRTASRVAFIVNSSVSFGMLVTNGPISQPSPAGMSRVSVTASFCK